MHLALSLPRVEGADLRPWVPPEHSLVISSGGGRARALPSRASADGSAAAERGTASLLTLEWEAAAGMASQKLKV